MTSCVFVCWKLGWTGSKHVPGFFNVFVVPLGPSDEGCGRALARSMNDVIDLIDENRLKLHHSKCPNIDVPIFHQCSTCSISNHPHETLRTCVHCTLSFENKNEHQFDNPSMFFRHWPLQLQCCQYFETEKWQLQQKHQQN